MQVAPHIFDIFGSFVSFLKPNAKDLLHDSFKPLQDKAFIVFNALSDNNAKWLYYKITGRTRPFSDVILLIAIRSVSSP